MRRVLATTARAGAVALLLGGASAGAATPAAPRVRIALRADVEVRAAEVTVGDVADVEGEDGAVVARVAALSIGRAPSDGSALRLERAALGRWVRARLGLPEDALAWSGGACRVRLAVREVSGDTLVARATEAVREAAARAGLRAEARVAGAPPRLRVPAAAAEVVARPVSEEALRSRRVVVWAEVRSGGRVAAAAPVSLDVTVLGPAWVAVRPTGVGEALDPGGFVVREVDRTGRDPYPVDGVTLAGLRLLRPLRAGEVLTRAHAEPEPLVRRGSWATLRDRQGLVGVERRVEVLEDGRAGQPVRVKAAASGAPIVARVAGADLLEVGP